MAAPGTSRPRRKDNLAAQAKSLDRAIRYNMANDDLGEMERDATVSRLQAEYYFTRAAQCLAADNPKAEREHRKEAREWMQRHSVAIEKKANDLIMKLAEQQDEDDKLYQSFVQITGDEEDDAGDPADAAGSSAG